MSALLCALLVKKYRYEAAPLVLAFVFNVTNPTGGTVTLDELKFTYSFEGKPGEFFPLNTPTAYETMHIPANASNQIRVGTQRPVHVTDNEADARRRRAGALEPARRIGRTNAATSAPSPRDPGGRHTACPGIPSLRPGTGRDTGAKASVRPAIALCPGPSCVAKGSRARGGRRGAAAGRGHRRVSGAASREGQSRGLREWGGGRWGSAERSGGARAGQVGEEGLHREGTPHGGDDPQPAGKAGGQYLH